MQKYINRWTESPRLTCSITVEISEKNPGLYIWIWDRIPVEIPGKNPGLCIWNETEFQLKYLEKILDCAYEMRQSKLFQLHRTHLPHLNHRSTTPANVNATYTASSSKCLAASFHVHLYILCTQGWRATAGLDICPLTADVAAFGEGRGSLHCFIANTKTNNVLCCCSAVLDPTVGHTMDVLSPFISVLCHSDWLFHGESCPRLDVVHPGRVWSSSPACTWHCSLHYLFLQATPLFPHGVTIVC